MKRNIGLYFVGILLFSACSVLSPVAPTPTATQQAPIPTPNPCSEDLIIDQLMPFENIVNNLREVEAIASVTSHSDIMVPIMRFHEIRQDLIEMDPPECLDALKQSCVDYSSSVINYLMIFYQSADPENESLLSSRQISDSMWKEVLSQFNQVLTEAGLETQDLPDLSSSVPQEEASLYVVNEGTQSVNVRARPDLEADIVASLEPGIQAPGLGRTETGDWVQISLDGLTGWVYTEMITLTAAVDELPVTEQIP